MERQKSKAMVRKLDLFYVTTKFIFILKTGYPYEPSAYRSRSSVSNTVYRVEDWARLHRNALLNKGRLIVTGDLAGNIITFF